MPTPTRPKKRGRITLPPAAATIPDDFLIAEVFLRLPVESHSRVKSVCRSWRAVLEDPDFVRRHLELSRSRPPSMLVIPRANDPDDDASGSKDVSFHRLVLDEARTADVALMFEKALPEATTTAILPTHCDGLVALATARGQIFICNPATREFVALPPGSRDVRGNRAPAAAALCYDSWCDRYVVARHFYRQYDECQDAVTGARLQDCDIGHEIFTLGDGGSGSSWVVTADPPHAIGPARPVCTRDAVYWCTSERYGPNALLRFDLRDRAFGDRAFGVVPCPPGTSFTCGEYNVTELAGKLWYVDANTETTAAFDVWVADDGPRLPEWSLRCRVDFDLFGRPGVGEEALLPVAAAGDEMIIAADYKQVYRYDARRKSVKQLVDMEEELARERPDGTPCFLLYHVVPYVESLVSIGARRP